MPKRELVKLHDAAGRLASKWDIPSSVTEQIVKAVLQGGKCFVRGRRLGEMGLRDISREISMEFPDLGDRAFERRIWKRARDALGLGRAMSPGRPKT